jgi:hypothetical protein
MSSIERRSAAGPNTTSSVGVATRSALIPGPAESTRVARYRIVPSGPPTSIIPAARRPASERSGVESVSSSPAESVRVTPDSATTLLAVSARMR